MLVYPGPPLCFIGACSECTVRFLPLDVPLFFAEFVMFSMELNAFRVFRGDVMRGQVATSQEDRIQHLLSNASKPLCPLDVTTSISLVMVARLHPLQLLFVCYDFVLLLMFNVRFLMEVREAHPQPWQRDAVAKHIISNERRVSQTAVPLAWVSSGSGRFLSPLPDELPPRQSALSSGATSAMCDLKGMSPFP